MSKLKDIAGQRYMRLVTSRDKLLTVAEVAKLKNIPKPTLYDWIRRKELPSYREQGKRRLYLLKEDVERLRELKATRVIVLNPRQEGK